MEKPRPLQLNAFTDANSGVSVTRLRGKLSHGRSHRLDLIHLRLSQRANWSLLCIPVRPHVEPFGFVPAARWLGGSQWHALTYLGSNWGLRDTRHPEIKWADWACAVVAKGGAITFDMCPNWDPQKGPIGALAEHQMNQIKVVQAAIQNLSP